MRVLPGDLISLHTSAAAALADQAPVDLEPATITHLLQTKSYGNEARVSGASVTAGGDVSVVAVELLDGANDTSLSTNFSRGDAQLFLIGDKKRVIEQSILEFEGVADAAIDDGSQVVAGGEVRVSGEVRSVQQARSNGSGTDTYHAVLAAIDDSRRHGGDGRRPWFPPTRRASWYPPESSPSCGSSRAKPVGSGIR